MRRGRVTWTVHRRGTVAAAGMAAVLLAGACAAASGAARTCQHGGGAEACLVENGKAYRLEVTGLRARSELVVAFAGEERSMVLTADDRGRVPDASGASGFLPGPSPQQVTLTGRLRAGAEVGFELEVPAVAR